MSTNNIPPGLLDMRKLNTQTAEQARISKIRQ